MLQIIFNIAELSSLVQLNNVADYGRDKVSTSNNENTCRRANTPHKAGNTHPPCSSVGSVTGDSHISDYIQIFILDFVSTLSSKVLG